MPQPKPVAALKHAIASGKYDHQLDRVAEIIVKATIDRGHELAASIAEIIEIDTHVKILGPLRPMYFVGKKGRVIEVNGIQVRLKLDKPIKRYHKLYTTVGVPANKLEILDVR